ncbi:MAG TPA: hypothetical protein PK760_10890, partial [Flavobacteriales bacterium]|nr:hypothetical protein [Flavobacteriales bacterium]
MLNFRYFRPKSLLWLVLVLAGVLGWLVDLLVEPLLQQVSWGQHLRAPSVLALIMGVMWVYNNWLWRLPICNKLITVPDLSGSYRGTVRYHRDGRDMTKEAVMQIIQTASHVTVHSFFLFPAGEHMEETHSVSTASDLSRRDGFDHLDFLYRNSGDKYRGTTGAHEGWVSLKYLPESKKLVGYYFTD